MESQKSGFTKFEPENSEITMDNSNENGTFSVSQGSPFIIWQEGNPLDGGPSCFYADDLTDDSVYKEDAIGVCLSTSSESENTLGENRNEELNVPGHVKILTSPSYDKNEFHPDNSFSNSLNEEWKGVWLSDNDPCIAPSYEGSEKANVHHTEIPTTSSHAEDYDLPNVEIDDNLPFILLNSEESQNQILTGVDPRDTSASVNNFEGVAGPSSVNVEDRNYLKEKRFVCKVCGKGFKRKCNLDVHCKTHTGEKPFSCSACGRTFSQNGHLKQHLLTHTGEKPFPCDKCERFFYRKGDLKRHSNTHTEEKLSCDKCKRTFSRKYNLNRHLHIHTREKKFFCDRCGSSFSLKSHLNSHLRSHGEKPFVCHICGKAFANKSNRKRHAENVHNKK